MGPCIRKFCHALGAGCLLVVAPALAQKKLWELFGTAYETLGDSVAMAGDVDTDGHADVIVGAAGHAKLVSGKTGLVLYGFFGSANDDVFGTSVAGIGDYNADGFDDVLVGATQNNSWFAPTGGGYARAFSGKDGTALVTLPSAVTGGTANDVFGASMACAGDLNADGFLDAVVGATEGVGSPTPGPGYVRAYSGADSTLLYHLQGDTPGDEFGVAVASAGDVDADGFGDLIVGARGYLSAAYPPPGSGGYARVYSGKDGAVIHALSHPGYATDYYGAAVAGPGDFDQDGYDDLAVGAPGEDPAGKVRVYSGADASVMYTLPGEAYISDGHGSGLASVGDFDGDGVPDLAVGASGGYSDYSLLRVYSGATGAFIYTLQEETLSTGFGAALAGGGDADGDGVSEIVVSAPFDKTQGTAAGRVLLLSGKPVPPPAPQPALQLFHGDSPYDALGSAVDGTGDVNMDGRVDLVVGAQGDDNNGADSGSVRVYSGLDGSPVHVIDGETVGTGLGYSVAGAGDVNGDGHADVIAGAVGSLDSAGTGYARVYSGADSTPLYTLAAGNSIYVVNGAGDMNVDGFPDVVIAQKGKLVVHSGADGSPLFTYTEPCGGYSCSSFTDADEAGDVDSDGFPDLIYGVDGFDYFYPPPDYVRVVSGKDGSVLHYFQGGYVYEFFGRNVAGLGDVDGDGAGDMGVAVYNYGSGAGAFARVFSGATGAMIHNLDVDALGIPEVSGLGDMNGDGRADIVVSDGAASSNGKQAGRVEVRSGADGALLATWNGDAAFDRLGTAVEGAGDIDADGVPDLIAGAPGDDTTFWAAGAAFVFRGKAPVLGFGAGCNGLVASWSGQPKSGAQDFAVTASGARPGVPVWLALGGSATAWSGIPLPLGLGPFGAPGCAMLAEPFVLLGTLADGLGKAALVQPIGGAPALIGSTVYAQWAALAPAANPLGLIFSNGLEITIQP